MAVCKYCDQEMTDHVACTLERHEGEKVNRMPNDEDQCHDCGVPANGLHHPGCDAERCPVCMGQAISCDCIG